jgi:amino acid permease
MFRFMGFDREFKEISFVERDHVRFSGLWLFETPSEGALNDDRYRLAMHADHYESLFGERLDLMSTDSNEPVQSSEELLFNYPTRSDTNMFGAFQILLNTTIGSGSLMVPYCFCCGLALELIISLIFAALAYLSMHFMIESARAVHRYDYSGLFDHCFKPQRRWILSLLISLMQFGALMIYGHWCGQLICKVVTRFTGPNVRIISCDGFWLFSVIALIVFPLSMVRSIGKLDVVSLLSTFFICMLIAHATYWLIRDPFNPFPFPSPGQSDPEPDGHIEAFAWRHWQVIITSFSVNSLAYTCHINLFAVYESLRNCTVARARRLGIIVASVAYLLYNLFGALTYLDRKQSVKLLGVRTSLLLYSLKNVFTIIATLGVVVLLVGSCPVVLWALRNSVNHIFFKEGEIPTRRWIALGGILVFGPALLASLSDDVILFFDVVGGLFTPILAFLLPSLFYLICVKNGSRWMRYLAYQHVAITAVGAGASMYQAITNIINS